MLVKNFSREDFGLFQREAEVDIGIHDRQFAIELIFGICRNGLVNIGNLVKACAGCAATDSHPEILSFFAETEFAVVELPNQHFRVFTDRIKHLGNFKITRPDIDAFHVVSHQLVEGAHLLNGLRDGEDLCFVHMLDFIQHFHHFGWLL